MSARKHTRVDLRELLVEELTKANGSAHHSWDMVRRIEAGTLELHQSHSGRAHELAAKLRSAAAEPPRKDGAAERKAFEAWTAPIGTPVEVTLDGGKKVRRVTRSMPWMLGGETPVILLEGIAGG